MKYTLKFNGRLRGAIGITYFHCVDIEADSPEEAYEKLYDTHDHISSLRIYTSDNKVFEPLRNCSLNKFAVKEVK